MDKPAQIDYLMAPRETEGEAEVRTTVQHPLLAGSDHRAVVGDVCCPEDPTTTEGYRVIQKGWRADNDEEREPYGEIVTAGLLENGTLDNAGTIIREGAMAIKHTTVVSGRKERVKKAKEGNGIAELKRRLR